MKKYIVLFVLVIGAIHGCMAQYYTGKITNPKGIPLIGADIVSVTDHFTGTVTNFDGEFKIRLSDTPKVVISYVGYKTKTLVLKGEHNNIVLEQGTEILNEVVVSASREQQKRVEVPAAISIVDKNAITETKALGIDQLVNQVSGVLMSTSRVASNEQHFMAVRSPISTRALFLYLEDGLQIRPTSVFNHNALLEMNDMSYGKIEVLKGPASSIYGSEAIGGSFNFITKNPSQSLSGSTSFQINDLGLTRYEVEVSDSPSDKFGFYLGSHFVQRQGGPIEHSDYEKFAVSFKTVYKFSQKVSWSALLNVVDYRSDMTGSLTQQSYESGNFESIQTFAERDALSLRIRNTLDVQWNNNNKTSFNLVFRDNRMDQNPSYRIRQFREQGVLTGLGSGEINSNQFNSFMGLIQHKIDFGFKNSSLIFGATVDHSPQDYKAERTTVFVDTETGKNVGFNVNSGDFILDYEADISNYAGFFQYEISPLDKLKLTAALRYDGFRYDYMNRIVGVGNLDSQDNYDNLTPKLGLNFNFNEQNGVYLNYSQGFTPPQVSTLYRNRYDLIDIKPSIYDNYEIGGHYVWNNALKLDAALYLLEGKNTLISLRDEDDVIFNTNAGKTRSYGIEYGVTYYPTPQLSISHNGSYAKHRYVHFFNNGVDFSDTDREIAPSLLGNSRITYKPFPSFHISAEHEMVGSYNTSFEGQVDNSDGTFGTAIYDGHHVFNLRASYQYKRFEIWAHALNIFDELYAARASYSSFSSQNSYTIGNPRAFHSGIRYNF
nr:TonB-dependent receptor [Allomuricauda sp.]